MRKRAVTRLCCRPKAASPEAVPESPWWWASGYAFAWGPYLCSEGAGVFERGALQG